MSEPDDASELRAEFHDDIEVKLYGPGMLGLASLKTEGAAMPYDSTYVPPTKWQRLRMRLRRLPSRIWWAVFGDEYY